MNIQAAIFGAIASLNILYEDEGVSFSLRPGPNMESAELTCSNGRSTVINSAEIFKAPSRSISEAAATLLDEEAS